MPYLRPGLLLQDILLIYQFVELHLSLYLDAVSVSGSYVML